MQRLPSSVEQDLHAQCGTLRQSSGVLTRVDSLSNGVLDGGITTGTTPANFHTAAKRACGSGRSARVRPRIQVSEEVGRGGCSTLLGSRRRGIRMARCCCWWTSSGMGQVSISRGCTVIQGSGQSYRVSTYIQAPGEFNR
jgi:hypothetical protein